MSIPLVSVVIPTIGRPQLLSVAINSALKELGDEVEVIVVPNGSDTSWKATLAPFSKDTRVRVDSIATANANAARNHGMALARGKYLRFLDDDDYLLSAAVDQLELLERTGAEICSGLLDNVDQTRASLGTLTFPGTDDFVSAAVTLSGFTLPTGNVFRRVCLRNCRWDDELDRVQDYAWMIHLAGCREWEWVHLGRSVGVWFQHDQQRTSTLRVARELEKPTINRLLALHRHLSAEKRLSAERSSAIAAALWYYVHQRFPLHPIYWTQVAIKALEISRNSGPAHFLYETEIMRSVNPLFVEWAFLPGRIITKLYRELKHSIVGWDYRRRL